MKFFENVTHLDFKTFQIVTLLVVLLEHANNLTMQWVVIDPAEYYMKSSRFWDPNNGQKKIP